MAKLFFTYFFSFIILASIVAPTYLTLSDVKCEVTEVADLGEEEENNGKESAKDLEVKIYYSSINESTFVSLEKKKRISFYSKNYTSHCKKLFSPPPESIS